MIVELSSFLRIRWSPPGIPFCIKIKDVSFAEGIFDKKDHLFGSSFLVCSQVSYLALASDAVRACCDLAVSRLSRDIRYAQFA